MTRRDAGTGSVSQRKDGLWIGRAQGGYTKQGKRRRVVVSAKTEAACKRKLRELLQDIDAGNPVGAEARTTVKQFADQWLPAKEATVRPKTYTSYAGSIRNWIVPTIGHRRLVDLAPGDARRVERAGRDGGLNGSSAGLVHAHLRAMLNDAVREGHRVPDSIIKTKKPTTSQADRQPIPPEQLQVLLEEAGERPDPLRWVIAMLFGWRQSEVLGLRVDSLDRASGRLWVDWQVQALPYRKPRDRKSGFRVPDEYEHIHLVDAWHLVGVKSRAGKRWAAIPAVLMPAIEAQVTRAEAGPHGLLFARDDGRPRDPKADRAEWHEIQAAAGVAHPSGRPWTVHECRNTAAALLRRNGADDLAQMQMMGHATIGMTRDYQAATDAEQLAVSEAVLAELLA